MVIREPLPFVLHGGANGKRPPPGLVLAIGVSVSLHIVAGAYVALQKFEPAMLAATPTEEPITVVIARKEPPPIERPDKPPKPPVQVRSPVITNTMSLDPIQVPPVPAPPQQVAEFTPTDSLQGVGNLTFRPDPVVITAPAWLRKPGAREFARFYPESAVRRAVEGSATLSCLVTTTGVVTDCRVARETPADEGFGAAALKLSPYFRMSPPRQDGQPVEGTVNIPIRFTLG